MGRIYRRSGKILVWIELYFFFISAAFFFSIFFLFRFFFFPAFSLFLFLLFGFNVREAAATTMSQRWDDGDEKGRTSPPLPGTGSAG